MGEVDTQDLRVSVPLWRDRTLVWPAVAILAVKAYTFLMLYFFAQQVDVPEDYRAFLYLAEGQTRAERLAEIQESFLERLAPYDGQYYLDIAERGYRRLAADDPNVRSGPRGNWAFFPLYPLLSRASRLAGHHGSLVVLVVLNMALSCAAAIGLFALSRHLGIPPWWSVLFLLTFPTAVFQCVLYTESVFLFL